MCSRRQHDFETFARNKLFWKIRYLKRIFHTNNHTSAEAFSPSPKATRQERKMERNTAKSLIAKNEKSLRHNNFWNWGLLIANTISNPHPSATWVHLRIHYARHIIAILASKIKLHGFFFANSITLSISRQISS